MSSTAPEVPQPPKAWCRRILTSLGEQNIEGREAGYREMLLTYFIGLNPASEAFDGLPLQFCAGLRPGMAEAASLLQRSWRRGGAVFPSATGLPPLHEALGATGTTLDAADARGTYINIEADRVLLHPFAGSPTTLGAGELQQAVAAPTASPEAPSAAALPGAAIEEPAG